MNVLLYGGPKQGKSIGAASAPGPILYLNADRPNATRMAHSMYEFDEVSFDGLQSMIAVTNEVERSASKYRTLVLDPIGEAYIALRDEMSGNSFSPRLDVYRDTGTHLERFCRKMCDLPINFVIVAHQHRFGDDEGDGEYLPYTGTNKPGLAEKLMAMVDVIGYVGIAESEDGQVKYMADLIGRRGRRGGDRYGLGKSRDLNLTEWVEVAKANTSSKDDNASESAQEGAAAA